MAVEIEHTCPLGSTCEEVKDGKIHRCAWYTKLVGKDPQSEKEIDNWGCAMSWMPTLMVEMSQTNRGQTGALESFRNETVKGQEIFNTLVQKRNNLLEGNEQ
jgi:hypothetical protein